MKIKLIFFSIFALLVLGTTQYLLGQVICATCPDNTVSGIKSSAFGHDNEVDGNYSFVGGRNSQIISSTQYPSHYSNVLGSWSKIEKGGHANVIGSFSQAWNNFSFVLGTWSKAKGSSSFAIGSHVEAWSGGSFIIGNGKDTTKFINSIPNSLMIGFGSVLPTLFVEKAPFSFENDRTGRIGIGNITSPEAKLHIRADAGEDANLMLQATGTGKKAMLLFNGGLGMISNLDPYAPLQFYAGGGKQLGIHLDGETGNVGIGLDNPSAQLDILGSLRIRSGNPVAGMVLTSDAQGNASWQTPSGGGGGSNWTVSGSNIYRPTGNVGIGTANAQYKLHIRGRDGNSLGQGNLLVQGAGTTTSGIEIGSKSGSGFIQAGTGYPNNLGTRPLFINPSGGKVIIGTHVNPSESFALAVAGKILAEEIKIVLSVPSSDYVFEPDYPLMPLGELEHFVASKKHLPEVPSAEEFSKNGYSIGEMDDLLLRKIEELTLYIIQQQKEIDALKQQMAK